MKNYKKIFVLILTIIVFISAISMSACSGRDISSEVSFYFVSDSSSLHTELQLAYINDAYSSVSKYADGTKELSKPEPVTITWQTSVDSTGCELYLSEDEDFTSFKTLPVDSNTIVIPNLKVRTKYYYKLKVNVKGNTATSKTQSFTTEAALPRFIDCDGVTNMRDLGGYNVDGGVVKQGLIYRCGRLNKGGRTEEQKANGEIVLDITPKGIETMRDLGIRSEIDLRTTSGEDEHGGLQYLSVGVLGDGVNYYKCEMEHANGVSHSENNEQVRRVFSLLADPDNYPLIIHCNIGTDRTGYIAYLVNGLLGVSQEDLFKDYLFSNFGNIIGSRSVSNISSYVNAINDCSGNTLSEKFERYLKDEIGVPQTDIDGIRSILIERHAYTDSVITQATCIEKGCVLHTCVDDESLSYYEYTGYGEHVFNAVSGSTKLRCAVCGTEIGSGELPMGYTAVNYVESTGTQYIDTNFSPDQSTRVVAQIDLPFASDGVSHNAFAVRGTSSGNAEEFAFLSNSEYYVSRYGDNKYLQLAYLGKMTVDMDGNELKINGTLVLAHVETVFDCNDFSLYIFGGNRAGTLYDTASMKLYSMEIYDNGTQVRCFVPCYRNSDNVIGLYDTLNGVFYVNGGSGDFIYG